MTELTRWEKFTGTIAKWIVVYVAAKINATAVLSLCVETARIYNQARKEQESE